MSRRVFLLGMSFILIALAFVITDFVLRLQPGVTEANAKRIRAGMTLKEVEAVLGGPYHDEQWLYARFFPGGDVKIGAVDYTISSNSMYALVEEMGEIEITTEKASSTSLRMHGEETALSYARVWKDESGEVVVYFSTTDRVVEASFQPSSRPDLLQRLRAYLGWQPSS